MAVCWPFMIRSRARFKVSINQAPHTAAPPLGMYTALWIWLPCLTAAAILRRCNLLSDFYSVYPTNFAVFRLQNFPVWRIVKAVF